MSHDVRMVQSARRITVQRSPLLPKRAQRTTVPGPVVKWAGGKTRLLDDLRARMPRTFRRYFEPFLGGGALFFRVAPEDAVLSDCNADLINMYTCVAWNVEAVIRRLQTHKRKHNTEHYYATREAWNARSRRQSDVDRAAAFIYLNKTCYNGLWRVNRSGGFNVPMGRYTNPTICEADKLRAASVALQKARLEVGHYADAVGEAASGDLVYFDPPYAPVSRTANFTSYARGAFGDDDQRELAELFRELDDRGCHVMLSNSDVPLIRELYDGYSIDTVTCSRAINSRATSRGAVNEVIVTNR